MSLWRITVWQNITPAQRCCITLFKENLFSKTVWLIGDDFCSKAMQVFYTVMKQRKDPSIHLISECNCCLLQLHLYAKKFFSSC